MSEGQKEPQLKDEALEVGLSSGPYLLVGPKMSICMLYVVPPPGRQRHCPPRTLMAAA